MDIGYYLSSKGGASGKGSNSSSGGTTSAQGTEPLVAEKILQKNQATEVDTEASGKSRSTASTKTTQQQLINDRQLVGRAGARELLESMGVDFTTKGSSALFLPENGVMIVRNTQDNLDMVDALVEQANASRPKQVEIESKFVEISQRIQRTRLRGSSARSGLATSQRPAGSHRVMRLISRSLILSPGRPSVNFLLPPETAAATSPLAATPSTHYLPEVLPHLLPLRAFSGSPAFLPTRNSRSSFMRSIRKRVSTYSPPRALPPKAASGP
jgi:hypothetical protein